MDSEEEEEDGDSDDDDSVSNGDEAALDDSVCPPSQWHTSALVLSYRLVTLMSVGCLTVHYCTDVDETRHVKRLDQTRLEKSSCGLLSTLVL